MAQNYINQLRDLLKKTGWSQDRLALELKVTFATLNRWINGHITPHQSNIIQIQQLFERHQKTPASPTFHQKFPIRRELVSAEWDSDLFHQARTRFERAADKLGLDENIFQRLRYPERALMVSVPFRHDDGSIEVVPGYRVQHNDALGPCKGGIRYHPNVSLGQIAALGMMMTWKCALMGLPLGGAKGGVRCDPHQLSRNELQRMTRRYTTEIANFIGPEHDIPAPDLGTNEQIIAWMMDTYSQTRGYAVPSVVTGKPLVIGGSLGRTEATGRSVAYSIIHAARKLNLTLSEKTRVAIQGFGNVGSHAALKMAKYGAKIVAVSDASGGLYNSNGLNVKKLFDFCQKNGNIKGYKPAETITNEQLLTLNCDILILAATEGQVTKDIAQKLSCKIMAEGANGPTTLEGEEILDERDDIFVIPDILANSGGVTVSYFEWVQGLQNFFWSTKEVNERLFNLMAISFEKVYTMAQKNKVTMKCAALMTGIERVSQAMLKRGFFP